MDIEQLMLQSLQLLGLGMGSVFVILSLLIIIITIVAKLVPEEKPVITPTAVIESKSVDNRHIAAIQAAIHKFRK